MLLRGEWGNDVEGGRVMKKSIVGAYREQGYNDLWSSPRSPDWTAVKKDGVCISLWLEELGCTLDEVKAGTRLNTRISSNLKDLNPRQKILNLKRIKHMKMALEQYGGLVDVVLLEGIVGGGVTNAIPDKGRKWKILKLEEEEDAEGVRGHFIVECLGAEEG